MKGKVPTTKSKQAASRNGRRPRGRPAKLEDERLIPLPSRVSADLKALIRRIGAVRDETTSETVHRLLKKAAEEEMRKIVKVTAE